MVQADIMSQESRRSSVSRLCMSRLVCTARVPRAELYKQQHRHTRGDTAHVNISGLYSPEMVIGFMPVCTDGSTGAE
jgi:hypothetical protein